VFISVLEPMGDRDDSLEGLAEVESEVPDADEDVAEELAVGAEEEDESFELEAGGVVEGAGLGVVDGGGVELVEGAGVGEGDVVESGVVVGLGLDVVLPESLDELALEPPEADCLFLRGIVKLRRCAGVGALGSNTSRMDIYKRDRAEQQKPARARARLQYFNPWSGTKLPIMIGIARPILASYGRSLEVVNKKGHGANP
jgi:hypothetical protein